MFKNIIIALLSIVMIAFNVNASSDGELILKKNQPAEIKDCFENFNRATFAFNQALDGVVFKPVANVYKKLPSPVRNGIGNSIDNLSNVVLFLIIFFKEI